MRQIAHGVMCALLLAMLTPACRTTEAPERQVQDATITGKIKTKLASDVRVATLTNVDVNTTNGVVTLAGQVRSEDEKRAVEEVTRGVPGVLHISNNLQVAQGLAPYSQ
jgi:hyperosmotically inducible periplasmic protein